MSANIYCNFNYTFAIVKRGNGLAYVNLYISTGETAKAGEITLTSYGTCANIDDYLVAYEYVKNNVSTVEVWMRTDAWADICLFNKTLMPRGGTITYSDPYKIVTALPTDATQTIKCKKAYYYAYVDWNLIANKPSTFPPASHTHSYLPLSGGTITGQITKTAHPTSWITGRVGATIYNTNATGTDSYYPIIGSKTPSGAWTIGTFKDSLFFVYGSDTNFNANNNSVTSVCIDTSGVFQGTAQVAKSVSNSLSIQLNSGTATVYNGSAAKTINITPSSIGAATSGHNHNIENLTNFSARVYDATMVRAGKTFLATPTNKDGVASFRTISQDDLPSASYGITDWNQANRNGFFMANNAANAPTNGVWYFGIVIAHNEKYVRQLLWRFAAGTDPNNEYHYERTCNNGTWSSWTNTIPAASLKWATARNVTYKSNSIYTVSGSFDGSSDIALDFQPRRAQCVVQNTNNYPWHRIGHVEVTGAYQDAGITLYVNGGAQGSGYGIFRVAFRTNASTASAAVEAKWLLRGNGLIENDVYIGYLQGSSKAYADIYLKSHGAYDGHAVTLISASNRTASYMYYTLIDSVEADNTTASDKKTSKEVYPNINADYGAAKTLYGTLYTATSFPTDETVVGTSKRILDINNSKELNLAPSKNSLGYNDFTYLAGWTTDGSELRAVHKNQFASAGHTHDLSTMINSLSVGTSNPDDADYYVCQYAGGGTTTTTYHRRSMSAMWNWIKGHCDSVYAQLTHRRLSDVCTYITDWNAATTNGFYMASNATNAPTASIWYFGIVISHNTNYLRQILYRFATTDSPVGERKYERTRNNGTWSSWVDTTVADFVTNAEIDKMF